MNPPYNFVINPISPTQITLSWENGASYQYIEIWVNEAGGGYGTEPYKTIQGWMKSDQLIGLTPSTYYCIYILGGNYEPPEDSDPTTEECDYTHDILEDPTDLVAKAWGDGGIELTWKYNSSTTTSGITQVIERKTTGDFAEIATITKNREFYRDTGLNDNETYTYRIKTVQDESPSGWSNEASATTINVTSAPATLTVVSGTLTNKTVRLTWDAISNATGYKIEKSTTGVWGGEEEEIIVIPYPITDYLVKDLLPNTEYWFRIRAYNATGNSGYTNLTESSITTLTSYVETEFEKAVRNPLLKPIYLVEINPKKTLTGFPLMSDDDLVGCWPLDETSGMVAYDKSKQGNDGTLVNMEEGDHVAGKVNNGLSFDGVNEKVSADGVISDVDLTKTGKVTLCGWFKRTAASGTSYQGFCVDGSWDNYLLISFQDSCVRVQMKGGAGTVPTVTDNTNYSGAWTHICVVKDGEDIELFVNGVSKGKDDTTGLTANIVVTDFDVSWAYSDAYAFTGLVDEVRIYKRALTATEIKALHDTPGHKIHEVAITDRGIDFEKVYEGGDEYDEKASKALVQANANSFYCDYNGRKLYIHTSAEDDPSDFLIEGSFWLYFTNASRIVFNSKKYLSLLSSKDIPGIVHEIKPYFEGSYRTSDGTISLANDKIAGAHYFDKLNAIYTWDNARILIKMGFEDFIYSQFVPIAGGNIIDKGCDDTLFTLMFSDVRHNFDRELILNEFNKGNFPSLIDDREDRFVPKCYGIVYEVPTTCIDLEKQQWKFHDGRIKSVQKVLLDDAELVLDTDYYIDYQRGIITIDSSVTIDLSPEGELLSVVKMSFIGTPDSADNPITNGAEIFRHIMNNEYGLIDAELELDSIYETKEKSTDELSLFLYQNEKYETIIRRLEHSLTAYTFADGEGILGLKYFQDSAPYNVRYIKNHQIFDYKQYSNPRAKYYKVTVYYQETVSTQEWQDEYDEDLDIQQKNENSKELDIYTYLCNDVDAKQLATTILALLNHDYVTFIMSLLLYDRFPGEVIKFSRDRAYNLNGIANDELMRVLRIELSPSDRKTIVIGEYI